MWQFPVHGFLKSISEKILPYSVYVDKWPDYEAIITKPYQDEIHKLPAYRLGIYSRNAEAVSNILCQPGFLPKCVPIRVFGLPMDLVPALEKTAACLGNHKLKLIKRDDPRYFISASREDINLDIEEKLANLDRTLRQDFYCSIIDPDKHGDEIALVWRYWKDFYETEQECIDITKYYIKSGHSLGVYSRKDDKLVSWMISNIDGSNMFGHTLEEYRRRNIMFWNMSKVAELRYADGEVFWGYVVESNPVVKDLSLKVGTKVFSCTKVVHCDIRPIVSKI